MTVSRTNKYGDVIDPAAIAGNAKIKFTDIGGLAVELTNGTGGNTVKGTIVALGDDVLGDYETFIVAPGDYWASCGVVLDSNVSDGSACWVVFAGPAQVLCELSATVARGRRCVGPTASTTPGYGIGGSTVLPTSAATIGRAYRNVGVFMQAMPIGTGMATVLITLD